MSVTSIAALSAIRAVEKVRYEASVRLLDKMLDFARSQAEQLLNALPGAPEAPHPYLGQNFDVRA